MLVPISWLSEYVDMENIDIQDFCSRMIMSGSNIEEVKSFGEDIKGIIVGKVVKVEKHPDADKLFVTQVDTGAETVQIITGADNVAEGDLVPVILPGTVLPGGQKITKGKLRGLESNGMLCSAKELGFQDKVIPVSHKDGIFILEDGLVPGDDFAAALHLQENVVEFEITPNRPDCLSMIGMARETAAVYERKIKYPKTDVLYETGSIKDYIDIEIRRPDLCKRYVGRVVKDVKILPSPWWMQKRLMDSGIRPINNVVDITNYVMLEFGVPIHAFDLNDIADHKIIVDTAAEGQTFVTLDGAERTLDQNSLLICDGQKGVALAGIMGGLNSEIKEDTSTIFIEVACFEASGVRKTSKRLGLRTEASSRFEKGTDANLCGIVADRVCCLMEALNAGTVIQGACDVYPEIIQAPVTKVRTSKINSLLGTALTTAQMTALFERLEMDVKTETADVMVVTPPTVRLDLREEIDYVEEVARLYGYDHLPATLPAGSLVSGKSDHWEMEDLVKETLMGLGLNEIQTYSFVSPKGVDKIEYPEADYGRSFVRLINPLGEENSVMRTTLIPNMLDVLERNFTRNIDQAAAFELGRIFLDTGRGSDGLPEEPKSLVIGMYGPQTDFYAIKGVTEALLDKIGVDPVTFSAEPAHSTFHGGRCARISKNGKDMGIVGEISAEVVEKYSLPERVYICQLNFEALFEEADRMKLYKPLPKYPAIERDIAVVVADRILSGDIVSIIREIGGDLLEKVELFDIYKGKQVEEGYKSIAYALRYRDSSKTLTDEDVVPIHEEILRTLKEKVGAILREL